MPGDLDGRQADAAGGGADQHMVARPHLTGLEKWPVRGDVGHPHGRGPHRVDASRTREDGVGGHDHVVAVGAVPGQGERGHDGDRIAHGDVGNTIADRLDHAGGLVAERGGEDRLFEVDALAEHDLGPVQADRVDADPHLARSRSAHLDLAERQHFGSAEPVELHKSGHGANLAPKFDGRQTLTAIEVMSRWSTR